MHSPHEYETAAEFIRQGENDCQISRLTGIARTTIRDWRCKGRPGVRWRGRASDCPRCDGARLDAVAYAYLLGLYLGDGCISTHPRTFNLRIVLDERYPVIIDECKQAMAAVRPSRSMKVGTVKKIGCVEVYAGWQHWPCLFPQHGPGRKHLRRIWLAGWQEPIVSDHPERLLRGLIHSDGCRAMNRVWSGKYQYPRYFFSNRSNDILQIFRDACDALGIRYRNPKPDTISVARREDVAALDAMIGPKA